MPKKNKKRIGFLSYFGWGRGQAYVTLCYAKMLLPEYDVFILKQGTNAITHEFDVDVEITENDGYNVTPETFKIWVEKNKLDAVVFNEYKQWDNDNGNNLVKLTKELGAKAYGYLVWERFTEKDDYSDYDRIIAPTISMKRFLRGQKVRKFVYLPYSIDLESIPVFEESQYENFTFFHPGGWGGVHNRKNTDVVIKAFELLKNDFPDVELVITSQKKLDTTNLPEGVKIINGDLDKTEIFKLFHQTHMTVLPSKWETVGLPIVESLAMGRPVITVNIPPMNEFIREGQNGYLVYPEMRSYPDIMIMAAEVDPESLKNKMEVSMNKYLYDLLVKNSKHIVEDLYNLAKNKKYFLDFLERDLK